MNEEEELKEGYARLRNDFWSNVKIRKLQKANPSAGLIYVRSIAYASDRLTDGDLTIDDLDLNLGATQEEIDTLVEAGLFEPSTIGYHIHDYLNTNRSREEITGTTNRNTERKRRSRMNAKVVNGEYTAEFEAFWKAYPRKVDKRAAFKAWANATRETDADIGGGGLLTPMRYGRNRSPLHQTRGHMATRRLLGKPGRTHIHRHHRLRKPTAIQKPDEPAKQPPTHMAIHERRGTPTGNKRRRQCCLTGKSQNCSPSSTHTTATRNGTSYSSRTSNANSTPKTAWKTYNKPSPASTPTIPDDG